MVPGNIRKLYVDVQQMLVSCPFLWVSPHSEFQGGPNTLWGRILWAHHPRDPLVFSGVESVYFLLSFIYIFCLFDLESLVRKSGSIILMSVGKLSPLNDMLHYFVALKGKKMCKKTKSACYFLHQGPSLL